jgi:hypothetical protein
MITAFFPLHPYLILPNNIAPYVTHAIKEKIALWFHIIVVPNISFENKIPENKVIDKRVKPNQ